MGEVKVHIQVMERTLKAVPYVGCGSSALPSTHMIGISKLRILKNLQNLIVGSAVHGQPTSFQVREQSQKCNRLLNLVLFNGSMSIVKSSQILWFPMATEISALPECGHPVEGSANAN